MGLNKSPTGTAVQERIKIATTDGEKIFNSGVSIDDAIANTTVEVQDEGSSLTLAATKIDFAGAGVTVTEPQTDEVLVTIPGGGSGSWVKLISESPTASPTWEFTWDETTYSNIYVVLSGIQCATDAVSIYLRLGSDNGGTIANTGGDYDGGEIIWEGTPTWAALADTDKVRLLPSTGNAAGEVISGSIEIKGGLDSTVGALIHSQLTFKNSAANIRYIEVNAFLDANPAVIDTVQLLTASGNFTTNGTIAVYGLSI